MHVFVYANSSLRKYCSNLFVLAIIDVILFLIGGEEC